MKIAVQNPLFLFGDPARNFNGYNLAFFKKYVSSIYLTRPWQFFRYRRRLGELGLNPDRYECIFRLKTLNNRADVLVGFDGEPYDDRRKPPGGFHGLKVWHVMDYVFRASDAAKALENNGVAYVMGYARHDLYCDFFKRYYAHYQGKVISVPFGYGSRFCSITPFSNRLARCVAMGAVNPVDDPLCPPGSIDEYIQFYSHKKWTHGFRRAIAENEESLADVDSYLPKFPETKNASVDPVKELNRYQLFVNDEGLLNFPPARTYEGIAAGCVMVASRNPIYSDLGFVDGVNYIAFEKNDMNAFKEKVADCLRRPDDLIRMHEAALRLAGKFSHENVADHLFQDIASRLTST